jgi:DNA-directed RNA polymerase specialized sigma24 family protein
LVAAIELISPSNKDRPTERRAFATRVASYLYLELAAPTHDPDMLALDEALSQLAAADPQAAELVKLRHFAGLTVPQAAEVLGIAPRTTDFLWAYARAFLLRCLGGQP